VNASAERIPNLDRLLGSIVALRAQVPKEALSASRLGTDRTGSAVAILGPETPPGLFLTVGYLVTDAEMVWLTDHRGRTGPAFALAQDQDTGFALVRAASLDSLDVHPLPLGDSDAVSVGDAVVVAGSGGRSGAVAAKVVARQVFTGYWEYMVEDALFTAPAHPHWAGTAVLDAAGTLIGIGSLKVEQLVDRRTVTDTNMAIPINLLKPILPELLAQGRRSGAARPWLGLHTAEFRGRLLVVDVTEDGPAATAGVKEGDAVAAVGGAPVSELADFYKAVWDTGPAGTAIPLTLRRDGERVDVVVPSIDRATRLRPRRLHS
jgi:S1-C subfamily serine protease